MARRWGWRMLPDDLERPQLDRPDRLGQRRRTSARRGTRRAVAFQTSPNRPAQPLDQGVPGDRLRPGFNSWFMTERAFPGRPRSSTFRTGYSNRRFRYE